MAKYWLKEGEHGLNGQKTREQNIAYSHVYRAVKQGRLIKPDRCSICAKHTPSRKLHSHHRDYSKPLLVIWLCASCHRFTTTQGFEYVEKYKTKREDKR